jgi:hypothetical protein
MKSEKETFYANRGVERNKTPLKNIIYTVEIVSLKNPEDSEKYQKYMFKDLGYLSLLWCYDTKYERECKNMHGLITPDELKQRIGEKQWSKFCQGKREFVIQRRIDGKKKKKKPKE